MIPSCYSLPPPKQARRGEVAGTLRAFNPINICHRTKWAGEIDSPLTGPGEDRETSGQSESTPQQSDYNGRAAPNRGVHESPFPSENAYLRKIMRVLSTLSTHTRCVGLFVMVRSVNFVIIRQVARHCILFHPSNLETHPLL
jgi:hypothetical protein